MGGDGKEGRRMNTRAAFVVAGHAVKMPTANLETFGFNACAPCLATLFSRPQPP